MLGWLELALDDAPALVVTGFEDGKVPESVRGDSYLPNQLRKSLGIVDNEKRLARDLYATELLLRSRKQVAFVTGRRSQAGEPQLPSRIVFHCDEDQIVPRVKRTVAGGGRSEVTETANVGKAAELPRRDHSEEVKSISVTAFKLFLDSPYQFYLEKVLKLQSLNDQAHELDPLSFGSLAHKVLQRFGANKQIRDEKDAGRIASFLTTDLRQLGADWFGKSPLPAVHLQLEQLEYRLKIFAEREARRRADGWEIRHVEWKPANGAFELMVDDRPMLISGRIDRIDYRPATDTWAIWDYKTGNDVSKPATAHRTKDGVWRDLQLPLYCLLAKELLGNQDPEEIGYIAISRNPKEIDFMPLGEWGKGVEFGEGIDEALETIFDVVRRIRRGEFFDDDDFKPRDPIFAAIGGVGVLEQG
jgi:RecB family exonuclease